MSGPTFMSCYRPFHETWSMILQEKGQTEKGWLNTFFAATSKELCPWWRIEICQHFDWTVWDGYIFSGMVKQRYKLWRQHAHGLTTRCLPFQKRFIPLRTVFFSTFLVGAALVGCSVRLDFWKLCIIVKRTLTCEDFTKCSNCFGLVQYPSNILCNFYSLESYVNVSINAYRYEWDIWDMKIIYMSKQNENNLIFTKKNKLAGKGYGVELT